MITLDLRAFRYFLKGRFWSDLWKHINDDDCWGMAAQLSYYFLLGFFPFLIFLSALVGFIPWSPDLVSEILIGLTRFLPENAYQLVRDIVLNLIYGRSSGILISGILIALWSASMAFNGMISVFNRAYQVKDTRSYLKTRSLALGVTVIVSLFMVTAGILLFFGDWLVSVLTRASPQALQDSLRTLYSSLRWLVSFIFLNIGIQIVYFTLPARRLPWRLISPGSIFSSVTAIFASQGFAAYVNNFGNYRNLYGGIGTMVILMIWFYLLSFFLLVGGEMDSGVYRLRRQEGRVDY
ncbi:MAG: YihY/virulence factor BrkB family protein [Acidobacteriota bacterium]